MLLTHSSFNGLVPLKWSHGVMSYFSNFKGSNADTPSFYQTHKVNVFVYT